MYLSGAGTGMQGRRIRRAVHIWGEPIHAPVGPVWLLGHRVSRGGNWNFNADSSHCAYRNYYVPGYADYNWGFRCVRGL
jgi:hypothetical protein